MVGGAGGAGGLVVFEGEVMSSRVIRIEKGSEWGAKLGGGRGVGYQAQPDVWLSFYMTDYRLASPSPRPRRSCRRLGARALLSGGSKTVAEEYGVSGNGVIGRVIRSRGQTDLDE